MNAEVREKNVAQALAKLLGYQPENLPTLPSTTMEIVRLTNSEDGTMDEMVAILNRDPPLSAAILRLANSPIFRTGSPITEVDRAVVLLGMAEVGNLALGLSVMKAAGGSKSLKRRVLQVGMWRHSVVVAALCDALSRDELSLGAGYYVYGLLHDIGKVAIDAHRPDEFTSILRRIKEDGVSWQEAESEVLMLDHAFLAGLLLEFWDLPEEVYLAVKFHHKPWDGAEHQKAAGLIHLADYLARYWGNISYKDEPEAPQPADLGEQTLDFFSQMGWDIKKLASPAMKAKLAKSLAAVDSIDFR